MYGAFDVILYFVIIQLFWLLINVLLVLHTLICMCVHIRGRTCVCAYIQRFLLLGTVLAAMAVADEYNDWRYFNELYFTGRES